MIYAINIKDVIVVKKSALLILFIIMSVFALGSGSVGAASEPEPWREGSFLRTADEFNAAK